MPTPEPATLRAAPALVTTPPPGAASAAAGGELRDLRIIHTGIAERAYEAIKGLIMARELLPGAKVTIEGLAQRLGVSRTPVAEALQQLAADGLVQVQPRVGTFVRGLDARDVTELWAVRLMIELEAVRAGVARATPEQIEAMHGVVAEMAQLVGQVPASEASFARYVALDQRLHTLLVETAGNRWLLDIYRGVDVHVRIANFRALGTLVRAGDVLGEHRAIAAAYARRDAAALPEVLRTHIERSRDITISALPRLGGTL